MPRFSLRRTRSRRAMNTSTSTTSPLTIPPTSPSPPPPPAPQRPAPPIPRRTSRFLEQSDDNRTANSIEAETQRLLDQHSITISLVAKLQCAARDRMFPLSRETNILRAYNAGQSIRVPANWAFFLAGPPPVAYDLATVVYAGDDNRSPNMRVYLDALGRELEAPVEPRFGGVESIAEMRGELSRCRRLALDELQKANWSWERQVGAQLRERVRAIGYMERALVEYKRANEELLKPKEEVVEPKDELSNTKENSLKPKEEPVVVEEKQRVPEEESVLTRDEVEVLRTFANGNN